MSSTIILAVRPGRSVSERGELSNSWGSAPNIWTPLWDEAQRQGIIRKDHEYDHAIMSRHADDLFALWDDERVPFHHRVALALTFDRWYVKREDYARLADDLDRFFGDFPVPVGAVNHWPAIISLLRSVQSQKVPALGFWWTTVAENPMATYGKKRDWSEYSDLYERMDATESHTGKE